MLSQTDELFHNDQCIFEFKVYFSDTELLCEIDSGWICQLKNFRIEIENACYPLFKQEIVFSSVTVSDWWSLLCYCFPSIHDMDIEAPSVLDSVENQNFSSFPDKGGKQGRGKAPSESMKVLDSPKGDERRKRGRPAGPSTKKGKAGLSQARRAWPRAGKLSKIYESKSDASDSEEKLEDGGTEMGENHAVPAVEQKECPVSTKALDSPKGDGRRKRGRPAGPSTKKGKAGLSQARRTWPRVGNPSKIYESKSDTSDADEKLEEGATEMGENHVIPGKECPEILETEIVEDFETSRRGKAGEKEVAPDNIHEEWLDKSQDIELDTNSKVDNSKNIEKLEVMVDPVQAMLLDMIPSLGVKKAESTTSMIDDEKPPVEQDAEPVKKKKVSYKVVAGALLKDW